MDYQKFQSKTLVGRTRKTFLQRKGQIYHSYKISVMFLKQVIGSKRKMSHIKNLSSVPAFNVANDTKQNILA